MEPLLAAVLCRRIVRPIVRGEGSHRKSRTHHLPAAIEGERGAHGDKPRTKESTRSRDEPRPSLPRQSRVDSGCLEMVRGFSVLIRIVIFTEPSSSDSSSSSECYPARPPPSLSQPGADVFGGRAPTTPRDRLSSSSGVNRLCQPDEALHVAPCLFVHRPRDSGETSRRHVTRLDRSSCRGDRPPPNAISPRAKPPTWNAPLGRVAVVFVVPRCAPILARSRRRGRHTISRTFQGVVSTSPSSLSPDSRRENTMTSLSDAAS